MTAKMRAPRPARLEQLLELRLQGTWFDVDRATFNAFRGARRVDGVRYIDRNSLQPPDGTKGRRRAMRSP